MNWVKIIAIVMGVPATVTGLGYIIDWAVDFKSMAEMIDIYQDPQTPSAWAWLMETYTEDRLGEIENRLDALEAR